MKKLFAALTMAIALCLVFAGCTSPQGGGNDETIEQNTTMKMYLTINEKKLEVSLENNASTEALAEALIQGDIVYAADDYGDFEKVGSLGRSLPRNDTFITAQAGDVILYSGNQIVLFYGTNSWSYTRLGKMKYDSVSSLREFLCAGEGKVQVKISLY